MKDPLYEYMNEVLDDTERRKPYAPNLVTYPEKAPEFDPWDDGIVHDVVAVKRLIKPIQELLILTQQIDITEESFGVNPNQLTKLVVPLLKNLEKACREEWEDK